MNDARSERAPSKMKRVLVLHDLHPDADNAAWRAGMLARAHGGWLRILNLGRFGDPELARKRLEALAWRLQEHLQIAVLAQAYRGSVTGELRRAADEADLLVMRVPSGLDAATGLQPLRAARLAGRPTLVVRTPANVAYRRVLVATPPDGDAEHMLVPARAMGDGKELPSSAPLQSAAALLGRERQLFPDLVVVPCVQAPSIARRFLSLTKADTLLLPDAAADVSRTVGSAGFGHYVEQPVLSETAP